MNRELRLLLGQAGYPDADDPDLWTRTVMQHNAGPIPRAADLGRDFMRRGFHLILTDTRGTPTHFAKCRSTDDPQLQRESQVLEILGSDPALSRTIPPTRSACSDIMRIQLSGWLRGPTLARLGPSLDAAGWHQTAVAILTKANLVAERALELLPDIRPAKRVHPSESTVDGLEILAAAGVDRARLKTIKNALATAPALPGRLQHGDLWPANAILADQSWWLLDFEAYGSVQVPLYDVFHLLRSIPHRSGHLANWLSTDADHPLYPWAQITLSVLRHFTSSLQLAADAIGGAYLYYLVDFTARMHHEGVHQEFAAPYLEELELVAADLQAGLPLAGLVPLGSSVHQASSNDR